MIRTLRGGPVIGAASVLGASAVLVFCLVAAQYARFVSSPWSFARELGVPVTPDEAIADLRTLRQLLARAYGGYDRLSKSDCNWEAVFRAAEREISRRREEVGPDELAGILANAVDCTGDAHLQFWVRDAGGREHLRTPHVGKAGLFISAGELQPAERADEWRLTRGWPDGAAGLLLGCESPDGVVVYWPTIAGGADPPLGWRVGLRTFDDGKPSLRCRVRFDTGRVENLDVPLHLPRVNWQAWVEPTVGVEDGDAPVVYVPTLDPSERSGWRTLNAANERIRAAPVTIVDLRGNKGGHDLPFLLWLNRLMRGRYPYFIQTRVESEISLQGVVNRLSLWFSRGELAKGFLTNLAEEGALESAKLAYNWVAHMGRPFRRVRADPLFWEGEAPEPYEGRIVMLVDRGCASACECAVAAAGGLSKWLVIGENTRGILRSGRILPFLLPHSRIIVGVPNSDGGPAGYDRGFAEGAGFLPDLIVDSETPIDDAKALARCLANAACAAVVDGAVVKLRKSVAAPAAPRRQPHPGASHL